METTHHNDTWKSAEDMANRDEKFIEDLGEKEPASELQRDSDGAFARAVLWKLDIRYDLLPHLLDQVQFLMRIYLSEYCRS